MNKKISAILISLLVLPMVIADDVNINVEVVEQPAGSTGWFDYILHQVGSGTGNILNSIGSPLMILIILMAIGTALGYIFESIAGKVGGDT